MLAQKSTTINGAGYLALAALLLAAMFYALPGGEELRVRDHAVQRHGADAVQARSANFGSDPGQRYDCPDGKTTYLQWLPDGRIAVSIIKGNVELTSFITSSADYVARLVDGCSEPWRKVHP